MSAHLRCIFPLFLALALLSFERSSWSQNDGQRFAPVLEITPDNPGIDDRLMLRLSIEVPANLLVNFPRLGDRLGSFAVTGQRAMEPDAEATEIREWVQEYRLEAQSTGDLAIPALTITVQDPSSLESIEVQTVETVVPIASIVPPETDIRDVKEILPPVPLPALASSFPSWLVLGILPLALLAFVVWRHRQRVVPDEASDDPKPAHVVALEALEQLQSESKAEVADSERFHIRLAAVLRLYLRDGFAIAAPLRTTEELLREATSANSPVREQHDLIAKPLGQCDLVKFGRHQPSNNAMQKALEDVVAFVRQTSGLESLRMRNH